MLDAANDEYTVVVRGRPPVHTKLMHLIRREDETVADMLRREGVEDKTEFVFEGYIQQFPYCRCSVICYICNARPGNTRDHIIPKARIRKVFGAGEPTGVFGPASNIAYTCFDCNARVKSDKTPLELVCRLADVGLPLSLDKSQVKKFQLANRALNRRKRKAVVTIDAAEMARRLRQSAADKKKPKKKRKMTDREKRLAQSAADKQKRKSLPATIQ